MYVPRFNRGNRTEALPDAETTAFFVTNVRVLPRTFEVTLTVTFPALAPCEDTATDTRAFERAVTFFGDTFAFTFDGAFVTFTDTASCDPENTASPEYTTDSRWTGRKRRR